MKIILSRKGFDSSAGGIPSPILPDGSLFSLPIPFRGEPITYAKIQFLFQNRSVVQTICDLCPAGYRSNSQAPWSPWSSVPAHLDPDLRATDRPRLAGWRPLFGQDGAAQTYLNNNGVGPGDLFLFFGWFRETVWNEGRLMYRRKAPDMHLIFGWLEVGDMWHVPNCLPPSLPQWALYHPHTVSNYGHPNNTIYVAARGGALKSFNPVLQLLSPA
jgi:hypothetical protein